MNMNAANDSLADRLKTALGPNAVLTSPSERIVYAGAGPEGDGGVRTENRDGTRAFYLGDDVRGNGRVPESSLQGARVVD